MLAHQGRSAASGVINLAWMDFPTGRRADASMLALQVDFRPVFATEKRILHAMVKSSPTRLITRWMAKFRWPNGVSLQRELCCCRSQGLPVVR